MHDKRNNKESRTYVQGLRQFGNTLPRGVKGVLKRNGYNYSEIINKWSKLVGKRISECSYPKSIKMNHGNNNGKLLLAVKRGDEIVVEYSKNELLNILKTQNLDGICPQISKILNRGEAVRFASVSSQDALTDLMEIKQLLEEADRAWE